MLKEIKTLGLVLLGVLVTCWALYYFLYSSNAPVVIKTLESTNSVSMIGNLTTSYSFSYGPADAKVTVVEFFDPECESCAAVAPLLKNEIKFYEGNVRWVFRYMAYHKNSRTAIKYLEAARKQNLYLELQTALFSQQNYWGEKQESTEKQILEVAAKVKSLNMDKLKKDIDPEWTEKIIQTDMTQGKEAGVTGTPTFFVNGVRLESPNLDNLIKSINERL